MDREHHNVGGLTSRGYRSAVVLAIDPKRRDRREFDRLVTEARDALVEVEDGDLDLLYTAAIATGRAVRLLMKHRWDVAECRTAVPPHRRA